MFLCLSTLSSSAHWVLCKADDSSFLSSVSWSNDQSRALSDEISSKLDDILKDNNTSLSQINKFFVYTGPGAFTGLRMGVAFALGLSRALEKPLIGIPTHELYPDQTMFIPTRHQLSKKLNLEEALDQNLEFIAINSQEIMIQKPQANSLVLGLSNHPDWPNPEDIKKNVLAFAQKAETPIQIEYGLEPKISVKSK